jgi:transcription elongation factor
MTEKALIPKSHLPAIGDKVRIVDGSWRGRFGFVKSVGKNGRFQVRSQATKVTDVFWLLPEQIERVVE